jgi:hypothetical protein
MISEWLITNNVEGNSIGLIWSTIQKFAWSELGKYRFGLYIVRVNERV